MIEVLLTILMYLAIYLFIGFLFSIVATFINARTTKDEKNTMYFSCQKEGEFGIYAFFTLLWPLATGFFVIYGSCIGINKILKKSYELGRRGVERKELEK